MTEMDGVIREHEVYFATLAEQAERYDEMAEHMRAAALFEQELDAEERNLLAVAFKQAVGQRRVAWRIVCAAEQEEQAKGNHMTTASARGYRKKIEAELTSLCQTILALLTDKLIPGATTAEAKVSYYKAQGDYYRYMAEISDDMDRTRATTAAKAAYEDGTKVAETSLKVTSPFRLGLALNHAVFYYEAFGVLNPKAGRNFALRALSQAGTEQKFSGKIPCSSLFAKGFAKVMPLGNQTVRIFVNLDVVAPGSFLSFLRQVCGVVTVAVFAARRRRRPDEAKSLQRASNIDLQGAGVDRSQIFSFQTETSSDVAADALLTLLYSKHAGARNYLISETASTMRQQWFKELLVVNSACQTVWLSGDLKLQLTAVDCVMNAPTEAVRIGRKAFEDAVREIDNLGEDGAKESALVMQLLRDNITLWTSDPTG
ncbi:BMH1 [Symbiodinium pilosum]|uniref:BMH1 protein n=1 Tax=Symbiodinium pilosum TaxID=2952 RepID=A0A812MJ76_SYMPI|nr:BMH1 [Symbiodinium pilosum]